MSAMLGALPLDWSNKCCFVPSSRPLMPTSISLILKGQSLLAPACANFNSVFSSELKDESLSARQRRKQRNERREQLKSEKASWKEEVENKLLEKTKARPKGLKYELDMSPLAAKGLQWWMVFVPSRSEAEMAETIAKAVSTNFPDNEVEVFVPIVPTKRRMKDGSFSTSKYNLHPGCVFIRTVLSRQVYDVIKKVRRYRGFFGKKVGRMLQYVMPTPVHGDDMNKMFKRVQEEEDDLKRLKEQAKEERKQMRALKKATEENNALNVVLNIGSSVRVISGPYANFDGYLTCLPDKSGKVQASLMTFGKCTNVELKLEDIEVNQAREAMDLQMNRI